jgi:competence protein ComEC
MKLLRFIFVAAVIVIALVVGYQYIPFGKPVITSTSDNFKVTFLDVGQADCTIIQAGNNAMLIDAGNNTDAGKILSQLSGMGIQKLDVIIGTHPHEDHIGAMDEVIKKFDTGQVFLPRVTATTRTFTDLMEAIKSKSLTVTSPVAGTPFSLGEARWTILAPGSEVYDEINDYSIVIRMVFGNSSFLFTGDAGIQSEKEMLANGGTLKSDVLKVGHHGSTSSTGQQFLQAVSPKYAVIFVGEGNDYGHPHQETLAKLNAGAIKTYRTDLNGSIIFTSDGTNLTVKTEK